MSIYIEKLDFRCSGCGAIFIPYKREIKCPKCGKGTNKDTSRCFGFINDLAESMKLHKKRYGWYTPDSWLVESVTGHIQSLIFKIFDYTEHYSREGNEEEYISNFIDNKIEWKDEKGDRRYFREYIKGIAFEILDIYKKENFASIKRGILSQKIKRKIKEIIRRWVKTIMP